MAFGEKSIVAIISGVNVITWKLNVVKDVEIKDEELKMN
jgi:hypothetical protein